VLRVAGIIAGVSVRQVMMIVIPKFLAPLSNVHTDILSAI